MATIEEAARIVSNKPKQRKHSKTTTAKREAKRVAQRERDALQSKERARQRALRQETLAEDEAPAAQRLNGTAEPDLKRGGFRRTDPLVAMNRRSHGSTVTHDHLRAVRRWRDDFDLGIQGATAPRSGAGRVDGGQGDAEEYLWLAAASRYKEAREAVGASLYGIVEAIGILGQPIPWIARAIGQSEKTTTGLIVAGLDNLADHYWPDRETRQTLIAKAMAKLQPLGFDFAISAIGEVIPQDRIGRKIAS